MNVNKIDKKQRGDFGEQAVCIKLENSGYNIIYRNYRKKCGEIDIVAENCEWLVFVEVKTRSARSFAGGAEAVNAKKRSRMVNTAQFYIEEMYADLNNRQIRFDVAEVIISRNEPLKLIGINYIESAFEPESDLFLFV